MRRCGGRQRLHETELCARCEVRVLLRTFPRAVSQLPLNHAQRVSACHGLACDRMPPESVVTDLAQPRRLLNGAHRSSMIVHVPGEASRLGKQKILSRVALLDMPPNGADDVLWKLQSVGFLVLSIDNLRWTCLGAALQSSIDDELRRDIPKSASRRGVHLSQTKA